MTIKAGSPEAHQRALKAAATRRRNKNQPHTAYGSSRPTAKQEQKLIRLYRQAIAHRYSNPRLAEDYRDEASALFRKHFHGWSEKFNTLHHRMMMIWNKSFQRTAYDRKTTAVSIGYSSFPVTKYKPSKIQPAMATKKELLQEFDDAVSAYHRKKESERT